MSERDDDATTCCGKPMRTAASAERGGDRVAVSVCETCERVEVTGRASSPGWVGARARAFGRLREEALERAGLPVSAAQAVLDLATLRVRFV